jgi:hypothetical protein
MSFRVPDKASPMTQPAQLREALLQAVDDGLLVPGEIVRAAIYERLEKSYHIRREEIPEKLETFHRALQDLLGKSANVMEKLIAKNFYICLGLGFAAHDDRTLVDYVNHARGQKRGA